MIPIVVINNILSSGSGDVYYRMSNPDGKIWLIPRNNVSVALNIYQPSSIKGKSLKLLFPFLHRFPFVLRLIGAERIRCRIKPEFLFFLKRTFSLSFFETALFCGTPSVHQKVTIQVFSGKTIKGYCKITDNDGVFNLFKKEKELLDMLNANGMKGIPRSFFVGPLCDGCYAFAQSSVKTNRSRVLHVWSAVHQEFILSLYDKTRVRMLFDDTDYCKNLSAFKEHLNWLPDCVDRDVVGSAIAGIEAMYAGKTVRFSACHGDFTPWNMFVEKGELFVFDWEYAQLSYPPMLDRYHFFTQSAFFEKHWSADDVIRYIGSEDGAWVDRYLYVLYILDVMARYSLREKNCPNDGVISQFRFWFEILHYLTVHFPDALSSCHASFVD